MTTEDKRMIIRAILYLGEKKTREIGVQGAKKEERRKKRRKVPKKRKEITDK